MGEPTEAGAGLGLSWVYLGLNGFVPANKAKNQS